MGAFFCFVAGKNSRRVLLDSHPSRSKGQTDFSAIERRKFSVWMHIFYLSHVGLAWQTCAIFTMNIAVSSLPLLKFWALYSLAKVYLQSKGSSCTGKVLMQVDMT